MNLSTESNIYVSNVARWTHSFSFFFSSPPYLSKSVVKPPNIKRACISATIFLVTTFNLSHHSSCENRRQAVCDPDIRTCCNFLFRDRISQQSCQTGSELIPLANLGSDDIKCAWQLRQTRQLAAVLHVLFLPPPPSLLPLLRFLDRIEPRLETTV